MRNVADTGLQVSNYKTHILQVFFHQCIFILQILHQLIQNVEAHDEAAQSFYQTYFTDILQHIFSVVTDTSHTAGLTMHATILAYMFTMVEMGRISVPLGPGATSAADNVLYIQEFVANLLRQAFPHLTDNQIKITVQGLFNLDHDINAFKEHLRDFLVQIRVIFAFCFLAEDSHSIKCALEKNYLYPNPFSFLIKMLTEVQLFLLIVLL